MKKCFVTVGSTRFDELIEKLFQEEVINALVKIGIEEVIIQNGNGKIPDVFEASDEDPDFKHISLKGIKYKLFAYKRSIKDYLHGADLIVGHAGAGTCLEVLELNKPFIAVVNASLMDNHQTELAENLAQCGHLLVASPEKLAKTLLDPSLFSLKPFERADPSIFRNYMEQHIL